MENSSVIRPLVDVNISDKVFDVLKKAIQCGELKPGDVLIERDLQKNWEFRARLFARQYSA